MTNHYLNNLYNYTIFGVLGVVETWFRREQLTVCLIDVGGQRTQRYKWLHCFENVNTVLFVVAMSEYDQMLKEETSVNRMRESLNLFGSMCGSKWLTDASMVLFLNKKDVFDQKILYSPLTICFTEYKGPSRDKYEASTFMAEEFHKRVPGDRPAYHHFSCAKDHENIDKIFGSVANSILVANLRDMTL